MQTILARVRTLEFRRPLTYSTASRSLLREVALRRCSRLLGLASRAPARRQVRALELLPSMTKCPLDRFRDLRILKTLCSLQEILALLVAAGPKGSRSLEL